MGEGSNELLCLCVQVGTTGKTDQNRDREAWAAPQASGQCLAIPELRLRVTLEEIHPHEPKGPFLPRH